jgi:ATP-dependent Clp protease ATP-binding subunit ClpB
MDEAAAQLRLSIDSLPPELDELERQHPPARDRAHGAEEGEPQGRGQAPRPDRGESWPSSTSSARAALALAGEKDLITSLRANKALIENFKSEAERKEREGDFERVAQIRYGELPSTEADVERSVAQLARVQENGALLPEEVDAEMIANVVSRWTGIPVSRLLEGEREKLLGMEQRLRQRVVGQDHALAAISEAVRRARAGCRSRADRLARSSCSARPASARPRPRARSPSSCSTTSTRWCGST